MEYETPILEEKITIEGKRYTYDLVVTGFNNEDTESHSSNFERIQTHITNLCKYGKEIDSLEITQEIDYLINSDLEDLLRNHGEVV